MSTDEQISEMARLRTLMVGVPLLKESRTTPFASKMWIDPEGNVLPQNDWHYQYFRDPEISKKWDVPYTNEDETRLAALRRGFIRVNYERGNGTLTVESGQRGWTKHAKDIVFMMIADNAGSIDNIRCSVVNDEGQTVRTGYAQVFLYPDREKLEHIPLISETVQGKALSALFIGG